MKKALSIRGIPFVGSKPAARGWTGTPSGRRWALALVCLLGGVAHGQAEQPDVWQPSYAIQSSPFAAPTPTDTQFVVDDWPGGLDTGCTFASQGDLVFSIDVTRHVGDIAKLKASGAIGSVAALRMPAWDVDYSGAPGYQPERDKVYFNGNLVPEVYLTGTNNTWKMNGFTIPIEWIDFPSDPGDGGSVTPVANTVRIEIDTANQGQDVWCTAIDWAELRISAARPVVMVHGIFPIGNPWSGPFATGISALGLPSDSTLNMGALASIGDNAAKIAARVASAKARWGVERVTLLTHSKGGIDSRHFAEFSDSVERLIQLGTPNEGSPLADAIQSGQLGAPPAMLALLFNVIAGPGGIQLMTGYMKLYNQAHGFNSDVTYNAVAGQWTPNCPLWNPNCDSVWKWLLEITGDGDTIVPVSSVFKLSYTTKTLFATSGSDKEALHTELNASPKLFALMKGVLIAQDTSGPGTYSGTPSGVVPASPARSPTEAALVMPGGLVSHSVLVDPCSLAHFVLLSSDLDRDLELVSPSGILIDSTSAQGMTGVGYEAAAILGGEAVVIAVTNPEPGAWSARVSVSPQAPAAGVATMLSVWFEDSALELDATLASSSVVAGVPATAYASLSESGQPVPGGQVWAHVADINGDVTSNQLLDDGLGADQVAGDGTYSGSVATSIPGVHRLVVEATGNTTLSGQFGRETITSFSASSGSAQILGNYSDVGVDADGDGSIDDLVVSFDVLSDKSITIGAMLTLVDSTGQSVTGSTNTMIPMGTSTLAVSLDGASLFANGVDGPFQVASVGISEDDGFSITPLAAATPSYQTAAYSYLDFEHEPLLLEGTGVDYGVDTDGNGLYDSLDVVLDVHADNSGSYQWSARLTSIDNLVELGFASGSGSFISGSNPMMLSFDGGSIGSAAISGPYTVRDVLVFGATDALVSAEAYQTQAYSPAQFEDFVPSAFVNIGGGCVGSLGLANLTAVGTLKPLTMVSVQLTGALPNAAGLFLVGFDGTPSVISGCTLPFMPRVTLAFRADANGAAGIAGRWPDQVLSSGTSIYVQYVYVDAGVFGGVASSSVVLGKTP